jgi:hypothetical protein
VYEMPPDLRAAVLLLLLLSAAATAQPVSSRSSAQTSSSAVNLTQVVADVQRALRGPVAEVVTLNTEFSAGGSSISVGDISSANTLAVQVS